MNSKAIIGAVLATVFVVSMTNADAARKDSSYLDITDVTVDGNSVWITTTANFHSGHLNYMKLR